jgi:hypothetical protein
MPPSDNPPLPSASETRRRCEQALASVRSAEWGSAAGRLHMAGYLTTAELNATRKYAAIRKDYAIAVCAPHVPRSPLWERGAHGHACDVSSKAGEVEAEHHRKIVARHAICKRALMRAGPGVEAAVEQLAVYDNAQVDLVVARAGLKMLMGAWEASRRGR